ncbi:ABC-2 type transport system permease protein [Cnuella takakiae]|uniref:ABC-2 type transport system permease protein n=2 Tax=Cnuella takakiae TaxID=1302690 RepID=A0A1M4Z735_9BACT|nr:ABC transporter permease [Cnuella takakiae]SHF13834.1 ABC-2 type transport system permease protein [Cnuella takakiae]
MRKSVLNLMAKQVVATAMGNKAVLLLMWLVVALMVYATITGVATFRTQTGIRKQFQQEVRKHWEEMPDKHPHRMAHYGYIAFRAKHPLSIFDFGVESYTGNAVFLEAHKQNSVNFSEASFSTGLLRFGEMSMATILQVLVPLVLFFIGFGLIATDRENGTLKLLLSQGASWKEIMTGRSLGLMVVAFTFLLAALLLLLTGMIVSSAGFTLDGSLRLLFLMLTYGLYLAIICVTAVVVSAVAARARAALAGLIGVWLLFAIVLPRTTQAIGTYLYPAPSRIAFETGVEKNILQLGDSHNPDDPYFKRLKDSVLKVHGATSIEELPFNYAGFQMREGERMSSEVYNRHQQALLRTYEQQNKVARLSAFLNPFAAVKHLSMAMSGTDFQSYMRFQQQTEAYRYRLAQHMNELQIKLVSNKKLLPADKPYSISSAHWKAFPDFSYQGLTGAAAIGAEALSLAALLFWAALLTVLVSSLSKKLKAV